MTLLELGRSASASGSAVEVAAAPLLVVLEAQGW